MREERIERVIGENGYPVDVISHFKDGKLVDNYDGSTIKKIMYDWSDREWKNFANIVDLQLKSIIQSNHRRNSSTAANSFSET